MMHRQRLFLLSVIIAFLLVQETISTTVRKRSLANHNRLLSLQNDNLSNANGRDLKMVHGTKEKDYEYGANERRKGKQGKGNSGKGKSGKGKSGKGKGGKDLKVAQGTKERDYEYRSEERRVGKEC